ncbi:DUF1667 domain-containing protein [Romboutsia weinsteinii]|uniref:DUF1667 domain-containing protein n=1 Tax=Romboutsia weinsteinii TaxID=2020949 RepID=A0A371IXS8_9FIRM|nr:DUF1667 domain-containing protein [Romboutsia weinsteinii]RDY25268.1 DUF1667 domain-containing protein [Romboutsia weinsteinii]
MNALDCLAISYEDDELLKSNKTELTCIVCPMGCHLYVEKVNDHYKVEGNTCRRGEKYAVEELTNPKRVITTTVKLNNSYLNLLPVKTEDSVPKGMIFEIMEELDKVNVTAPIKIGDIIIENVLGTGVNVISTKTIECNNKY